MIECRFDKDTFTDSTEISLFDVVCNFRFEIVIVIYS